MLLLLLLCVRIVFKSLAWIAHFNGNCHYFTIDLFRFCELQTIGHHTHHFILVQYKFILWVCVCAMHGHQENFRQFYVFCYLCHSTPIYLCCVCTHMSWTSNSLWIFILFYACFFFVVVSRWRTRKKSQSHCINSVNKLSLHTENFNCYSIYFLSFNWIGHQKKSLKTLKM